jgi:hypothetical protein
VAAAKANAIDVLIQKTIGVDVYILSDVLFDARAGDGSAYSTTNWAGDAVFVVPLQSNSKLGAAIEVVQAVFDSNGLLLPTDSRSHSIELKCNVAESVSARALVDAHELLRVGSMSTPIATITAQIYGLDVYSSNAFEDAGSRFDVDGVDQCVVLRTDVGERVGKCGCRVSQCVPGSLIADAMRFVSGADFAVTNGGGIRAGLSAGGVSRNEVRQMLPFLDTMHRIDRMLGSTIIEMLGNSVAMLGDPMVTTAPDGRYLQVSIGLRFEWHFEGSKAKIGTVEVCRNSGDTDTGNQTACVDDAEYEILSEDAIYRVAVPSFIAGGGDYYLMLMSGYAQQAHYPLHRSQYEVVVDYLERFEGELAIDLVAEHSLTPQPKNCKEGNVGSQRVCQTDDVVQIPIAMFCTGEAHIDVQECDQAYHMAEAINNKNDGFMDDLLPHARLVLRETHGFLACSSGEARAGHNAIVDDVKATGMEHMFVATIGPSCSNDVADVAGKVWRDESLSNRNNLVISGSSTASTLSDEEAYPNLARMSTPEKGIGEGFAYLCKKYGWGRVAIVHDSSTWGTDSAKKFESALLQDASIESDIIYMDFDESELDRSKCDDYTFDVDPERQGKIQDAKEGCDPLTSFSFAKIRAGYPAGDDACDPEREDHFCMDKILRKLTEANAKIIFVAAQTDIQRALFRAVYVNRDEPTMDLYGEGFAWMSSLVDAALFQKGDGTPDMEAFNGAVGVLGVREAHDKTSDTFKTYTTLWDGASSKEACCTAETSTTNIPCLRTSPVNVTVPSIQTQTTGAQHNFCDADGDGTTAGSYSFSVADCVITLARALAYNNTYKDAPHDPDSLYASLMAYSADLKTDKSGVTGTIHFDPESGDRRGDLEFVNLQTITVVGNRVLDGGLSRNRRVVELERSVADFKVVGKYKVGDSGDRAFEPVLDEDGSEVKTYFPSGTNFAPSDGVDPDQAASTKDTMVIVWGSVGGFVVLVVLCFVGKQQLQARAVKNRIARLEALACRHRDAGLIERRGSVDDTALEGVLFEAIALRCFSLVQPLLLLGADASVRDHDLQLPITRLLAQQPGDQSNATVRKAAVSNSPDPVQQANDDRTDAVHHLLAADCEFDLTLGLSMLHMDATRNLDEKSVAKGAIMGPSHQGATKRRSVDVRSTTPLLVSTNPLIQIAVSRIAASNWRSADGTHDTVAHRLYSARFWWTFYTLHAMIMLLLEVYSHQC